MGQTGKGILHSDHPVLLTFQLTGGCNQVTQNKYERKKYDGEFASKYTESQQVRKIMVAVTSGITAFAILHQVVADHLGFNANLRLIVL